MYVVWGPPFPRIELLNLLLSLLFLPTLLRALAAAIGGTTCSKFSPDGSLIFAGTTKGSILVFDANTRKVSLSHLLLLFSFPFAECTTYLTSSYLAFQISRNDDLDQRSSIK